MVRGRAYCGEIPNALPCIVDSGASTAASLAALALDGKRAAGDLRVWWIAADGLVVMPASDVFLLSEW
ncbi:hypothetical protein ColTof3_14546 [Colletotrichum tofieldiae]|nr:hypothetical protein ColTof3_14546 [Colletotrichum tofieldiae]